MTPEQKQLAFELLTGEYYLALKKRGNGKDAYMLYSGNQNPVRYYSMAIVRMFKMVLKTDKKKRLTANLSLVRQLHGKSHIKKTYKNLKITI